MCDTNIPDYLIKNVMFNRHVQIGPRKDECFEIAIIRGPKLYVTKEKQVLALCDLSKTIIKGVECQQSDFGHHDKVCDFDICFSYNAKKKHVFFLLKIRDKLIVMTKWRDEITVHKEYENVRLFKVEEKYSIVHLRIEMCDGSVTCEDLYRIMTDHPMVDHERFD